MSQESPSPFEQLNKLTSEMSDKDLIMVAQTIFMDPSVEADHAAKIFDQNLPFWVEYNRICTELDPEKAEAMTKGAALLLAAMFRHTKVEELAGILKLPAYSEVPIIDSEAA